MPEKPRNQLTGQVRTPLGRVSLCPRGEYQEEETYKRLDVVQSGGSGWICLVDGTVGITPVEGENWMRFADNGSAAMYEEIQQLASQVQSDKEAADDAASTAQAAAETATSAETTATQKAQEAAASAAQAVEYSGNPPTIGEDGNWQTWDAEAGEYTPTDKPSRGDQGEAGVSPTVTIEKVGNATKITITDATGPHEATILDGENGGLVGAVFTVTLSAESWADGQQTVENDQFLAADRYAYIVGPASDSYEAYTGAAVRADDVTVDGSMTFKCETAPAGELTVNIVKLEVPDNG
nr:hypothetical protein [uncultured Dysosmobacter sp.]